MQLCPMILQWHDMSIKLYLILRLHLDHPQNTKESGDGVCSASIPPLTLEFLLLSSAENRTEHLRSVAFESGPDNEVRNEKTDLTFSDF